MRHAAFLCLLLTLPAQAVTLHVSAPALERTLRAQLFTSQNPATRRPERYFLKGNADTPCFSYADDPHVFFAPADPQHPGEEARIHVTVQTHSKFGTTFRGSCLGITLNTAAEVSFIPSAEGESLGFRDARIEHASENRELNFFLEPFLAKKLPAQMRVDAAYLMRTLLLRAPDQTGYRLTLNQLNLRGMRVENQSLLINLDADLDVN